MKIKHSLWFVAVLLVGVCAGFSQPANDNFADRIQLSGNNVSFVGSLAGATVESNEVVCAPRWCGYPATRSVWWSWTATESGPVHILAMAYSQDTYLAGWARNVAGVAVYAGTNVFGNTPTNTTWLDQAWDKVTLSFQAVAGTEHEIQFFGVMPSLAVTFQLIATNPPLILEGPKDQTVLTNGSALFAVLAAGLSPLQYQWRCNGIDIPGANDPMLALDALSTNQTGDYSVVVSNATGLTISDNARLKVTATAVQPVLNAVGPGISNSFSFVLNGESGRYYRIESSTDLLTWKPELAFPSRSPLLTYPPGAVQYRSVIYAAGSNALLVVPQNATSKFLRATVYTAPNEICINHLKQLRFAKDLWFRNTQQSDNAVPYWEDLVPYCANIETLSCPVAGGGPLEASYYLSDVFSDPVCKVVSGHKLEEPR